MESEHDDWKAYALRRKERIIQANISLAGR